MTRRANGEGSIYQRKSDGKWVGALSLEDGRRRTVYGGTQREVRQKLQDLRAEVEDGITVSAARMTVASYLSTWVEKTLPAKVKAGALKSQTLDSYRYMIELHIAPHLGRRRLRTLQPSDVRGWLALLQDKEQTPRCAKCAEHRAKRGVRARCPKHENVRLPLLSSRSVAYAHAILRSALSDAVDDQLIPRNVATMVTPPSGRRQEIRPLDDDEAAKLLATAADDRLGILWLTMLALGLRLGEALGLRWEDLDLDVGTVAIHRTLQRQRGERDAKTGRRQGRLVESTPKTEAATAVLPLPTALREALRRHRVAQGRARLAATFWSDPTMVFTTRVGTQLEPRNVHRAWTALSDRAGVRRSRPHDLRHTTATFLLAEGVDLKVIQKTLRHSRYQTTADTYAHVAASLQLRAAMAMDGVLKHLASDQRGAATSAATD